MDADFSDLEREFPDAVRILRSGPVPQSQHERPSEQLWQSISSAAAQEQLESGRFNSISDPIEPVGNANLRSVSSATPPVDHPWSVYNGSGGPDQSGLNEKLDSSVVEMAPRRRGRSIAIGFASAAAVLLVGLPLFLGIRGDGSNDLENGVELAAMGDSSAEVQASLDGRTLSVGFDELESAPDSATYELWLLQMDADGSPVGIEWVGTVDHSDTAYQNFEVPTAIDTDMYTVVDVSIEPDDGDPSHSGNSVFRGDLNKS